jgi:hypothetical protein
MSLQKPGPTTNTSTNSTTNTTANSSGLSTISLPDWYTQYFQNLLGEGNNLYGGLNYTTMGMVPDQWMASNLGNYALQDYINRPQVSAYDVFGMGNQWDKGPPQGAGFAGAPAAVASQAQFKPGTAAQLQPGDIPGFMNPYIEAAMNPVLDRLQRQQGEVGAGIGGRAAASGSFGGSREAVERSLADRNYRETLANTAGSMLMQGYDKASGLASGNVDRQQQNAMQNAALENQMATANAQMGTNVSLGNMQSQTQAGIANAQQQNDLLKQYYGNQFTGAQNDAARFLQALGVQNSTDFGNLANIMQGAGQLNQFGTQQQATGQKALDSYWQQLNFLAALLSAGKTGQTTATQNTVNTIGNTTGNTTATQSKPIDLASILLGGAGLLFGK